MEHEVCHVRPPGGTLTYCGTLFDAKQLAHPRNKWRRGKTRCECSRPICPRCIEMYGHRQKLLGKE